MPDALDQVYGAEKSMTLEEFTEWLWDKESGWGQVVDIGHTAEGTAATLRYAPGALLRPEVRPVLADQKLTVPGKRELCRGTIFVSNELQEVAVFR